MPEPNEIEMSVNTATRDALSASWGALRQGLRQYYKEYEDREPPAELLAEVDRFYQALTDNSLASVTIGWEFDE